MKERHVTFPSGDLTLEGLLAADDSPRPGAVVCHPHPQYGGSMHNNVVEAILDALWEHGYATLRFNFRGVGASEGEYDGGQGEGDDAASALKFLLAQPGISAGGAILAGYSFGAMVALMRGLQMGEVSRVIAVALPVAMATVATGRAGKPVLLVSGDSDSYSPLAGLESLRSNLGEHATLKIVGSADHFFAGFEDALTKTIASALVLAPRR